MQYLKKALTEPPQGSFAKNKLWNYVFLAILVAMLAKGIWDIATTSYPYLIYRNLLVCSVLMINLIAFFLSWPRKITIAIRIFAILWVFFVLFYSFCS